MTDDKIAEIRDLYKYLDEYPNTDVSSGDLHHYLSFLLAEVERLRAALRRIGMPLNKVAFCRDGHEIAVLLARNALEGKP